jgi:ubiquinone/menaquinone biosynthesis C-methylase UbiE
MTLPERLTAYHSEEGAEEYLDEYVKVHRKISDRRERRLLDRWRSAIGAQRNALDLPCGWGRYLPWLADEGCKVIQADYSGSMLTKSRKMHPDTTVLGGIRCFGHRIPLRDEAMDLVFSMRLNHHLVDPEVRRDHIREMFRVSGKWVIFSYFDHASLKNVLRRARTAVGLCDKPPKNTMRRSEVTYMAAAARFEIVADPQLFRIGSGHRLVLARRRNG